MIRIEKKTECSGCWACYNVCPVDCITMQIDSEGFWYPKVDESKCIACGACEKACHIIHQYEPKREPTAYAAYCNNELIRKESSSGGVFTPICEFVLKKGGVVFGAVFNQSLGVHHMAIDDIQDIAQMRGSKYVQSKIGTTYKEAKQFLVNGRQVLFSGTPCQIAGLKQYLKKDYENLFTVDIVCHGVPSPKVWKAYKKKVEDDKKSAIISARFRDKIRGWRMFSMVFELENQKKQIKTMDNDPYLFGFFRNLYLRPSCYDCVEKSLNRKSDLTIADYWGIEHLHANFSDDKGISLVFANSSKGKAVFEQIKSQLTWIETDIVKAAAQNHAATHSVDMNPNRNIFFKDAETVSFDYAFKKYCKEEPRIALKKRIDAIIKFFKDIIKKLIRYRQT